MEPPQKTIAINRLPHLVKDIPEVGWQTAANTLAQLMGEEGLKGTAGLEDDCRHASGNLIVKKGVLALDLAREVQQDSAPL